MFYTATYKKPQLSNYYIINYTSDTITMAPSAIIPEIVDYVQPKKDSLNLPGPTRARLEKAGIDLSGGYPVHITDTKML